MNTFSELSNQYGYLRDIQFSAYTNFAKKFGITTLELLTFAIIFHNDGCNQAYICTRTSTNKQTISEIIKKYIKLDYLFLKESKEDKRSKEVYMTDKGSKEIGKIIKKLNEVEVRVMSSLSEKDAKKLLELTKIFSENMKAAFDFISVK